MHIPVNAAAWMAGIDFGDALGRGVNAAVGEFARFAAAHNVRVGRNFGRHTCATMHCAAFGDPRRTEAMLGTSSAMRVKHYMGLATKAEGERYFGLLPSTGFG